MSGCEGCFQSQKGLNEAYEKVKAEAKAYALETGKNIAIYREGYEYLYIDAETAFKNNYQVRDVVSKY